MVVFYNDSMRFLIVLCLFGGVNGNIVQRTGEGKVVRGEKFCYSGIKLSERTCPDDMDGKKGWY